MRDYSDLGLAENSPFHTLMSCCRLLGYFELRWPNGRLDSVRSHITPFSPTVSVLTLADKRARSSLSLGLSFVPRAFLSRTLQQGSAHASRVGPKVL